MTADNLTPAGGIESGTLDKDCLSLNGSSTEIELRSEDNEAPPERAFIWKRFVGIVLTILASLFLTIGSVIVKSISEISVGEMAAYRFVGQLLLAFILVVESKENWLGPSSWNWRLWMLIRSLSGTTNIFLLYLALKYIPLADATIFMLSVPVFVFIFARIFLKEKFGRWHVLAMFISTVGIALASKIDFNSLLGGSVPANGTLVNSTAPVDSESNVLGLSDRFIGILLCIVCIFTMSFVFVSLRKIRSALLSVILFNFALIGLIEMVTIDAIWFQFRLPVQQYNAYWMMANGVLSFFAHVFLTKACQLEEAGIVSVVRASSDAVFAFVFQVAFFGEPLELFSLLGAILVLSSIFFLTFRKYVLGLPDQSSLKKKLRFLE